MGFGSGLTMRCHEPLTCRWVDGLVAARLSPLRGARARGARRGRRLLPFAPLALQFSVTCSAAQRLLVHAPRLPARPPRLRLRQPAAGRLGGRLFPFVAAFARHGHCAESEFYH